jgi:hypothetical protein
MQIGSCDHDPVRPMVGVLTSMAAAGIPLGDVRADSGYAHRVPVHFALPLRAAGASLVMDLHPKTGAPGNLYWRSWPPRSLCATWWQQMAPEKVPWGPVGGRRRIRTAPG